MILLQLTIFFDLITTYNDETIWAILGWYGNKERKNDTVHYMKDKVYYFTFKSKQINLPHCLYF